MGIIIVVYSVLTGFSFVSDNQEFFDTVGKQLDKGYEWHYTGVREPPKNTKYVPLPIPSILLEDKDKEYIMFQLKKNVKNIKK